MNQHQFEQIAERLKGLRDALDMSIEEFAASCNIPLEEYKQYEAGDKDLTVSLLKSIAEKYNIDVTTLLFAEEPKMKSYFVTRKGKGQGIERVSAYAYRTLAGGFNNRKADVFEVTVEPKNDDSELHQSMHEGQEFELVLEGRMLLHINGKDIILNEGDSIYFDSSLPHGMKALDGKKVRFIAVIL
ncbi:helix-turn-helix domain-containing protein [Dysgonomonas sp. 25]|uniref:helix-turn-helix domain-containing protein n=1 Tax=Dysgonomonas sp. 25 TaxID=2302933 RepID=UPI0013D4A08B|nr:XRE family transcriptional regulator [Dysgonomonas sp. 25]NDV67845.1 XRE family transcriptional regulator [Dysgonomonas sp. 25]